MPQRSLFRSQPVKQTLGGPKPVLLLCNNCSLLQHCSGDPRNFGPWSLCSFRWGQACAAKGHFYTDSIDYPRTQSDPLTQTVLEHLSTSGLGSGTGQARRPTPGRCTGTGCQLLNPLARSAMRPGLSAARRHCTRSVRPPDRRSRSVP